MVLARGRGRPAQGDGGSGRAAAAKRPARPNATDKDRLQLLLKRSPASSVPDNTAQDAAAEGSAQHAEHHVPQAATIADADAGELRTMQDTEGTLGAEPVGGAATCEATAIAEAAETADDTVNVAVHSLQQGEESAGPGTDGAGREAPQAQVDAPAPTSPAPSVDSAADDGLQSAIADELFRARDRHAVHCLLDANSWAEDFLDEITSGCDIIDSEELLNRLADSMEDTTISTSFSGVGSPEVASNMLHAALRQRLPHRSIRRPRVLSQVEWDKDAQAELMILGEADNACLFGDIASFFRDDIKEDIGALKSNPAHALEVMAPVIASGNAMTRFAPCLRHGRMCGMQVAKRHVAGTSCTAFSAIGARQAAADGTIVYFLAWVGMRLLLQEPEVVQENVKAFDTSLIARFLGHLYFIDSVILDPTEFGWASARERKWTKCRHRAKILSEISPLSRFVLRFHRACKMSWREYFFMHKFRDGVIQNELAEELAWSQTRPCSKARGP